MRRPGMEQAINSLVSRLKQHVQPAMDRAGKTFDEPAPTASDETIPKAPHLPQDIQRSASRSDDDIN